MDLEKIYEYYKQVNSLRKTAKHFNINREKLTTLLKNNNYCINEPTKDYYTFDSNYFNKINTSKKAYWLGFIYADGCLNKHNTLSIELKSSDKNHIVKFKKDIKSTHQLFKRKDKDTYYIRINNKEMAETLYDKGITPNKSFTLTFPTNIDDNFKIDFIRGYFDGDGSIYNVGKKSAGIGIIGTKEFLQGIQFYFNSFLKLKNLKLRPSRKSEPDYNVYRLETTNLSDTLQIADLLYNNCNIYLERKYKKYKSIKDGTSTTTIDQSTLQKYKKQ